MFVVPLLLLFMPPTETAAQQDAFSPVLRDQAQRVAIFENAAAATVLIYPNAAREGGGSGVLIDADGYGVTNFHVVAEFVGQGGYGALNDGKLYPLTVLGIDPGGDVAMFKLDGRDEFPFAPFGPKSEPQLGQTVAAMGNPFVLSENYDPTISMGVISGLHRYQEGDQNLLEYADCIQVSTSINPGNSGGPLFDLAGHVIGINGRASFEERGRVNVGLGYAITTQQIARFIPALRAGLLTQHGTLGATVRLAGDDLIVDAIQELSPAEKAGIQIGDVIRAIDGERVQTPNEFNNLLAPLPAEWPVTIKLVRDGKEQSVQTRLEALPIRLQTPFLPEVAHQHAAVRRYFAKFRDGFVAADAESFAVSGVVASSADDAGTPFSIQFRDDDVQVESRAEDREALTSLSKVLRPLAAPIDIGFGWTIIGSDKINEQIVGVVQHGSANGPQMRWYFADATNRILRACAKKDDESAGVCWEPVFHDDADQAGFPTSWRSRSNGDELWTRELTIRRADEVLPDRS